MKYCMEALKPSLRGELAVKSTQQISFDEFLSLHETLKSGSTCEDFPVENFLDLSNGEFQEDEEAEETESSKEQADDDNNSNPGSLSSDSHLSSELILPVDEIAELEWVSHFVDDSLPEASLVSPAKKAKTEDQTEPRPKPEPVRPTAMKNFGLPFPLPVKSRRKRTRNVTARPVWPISSLGLSQTSFCSGLSASCLIITEAVLKTGGRPVKRKQKRKPVVHASVLIRANPFQRRCSHCGVQKTPQWRTGPLGAKTLCNACGVRHKSGRLFPEYRPACSPTFSSEIHSNSHRKVLEMREKKESIEPEICLTELV